MYKRAHFSNVLDIPTGLIMPWSEEAIPFGWLLCYGQAVSRVTYQFLFDTIGITYGSGDGINTFNVPDLRGRILAGQDSNLPGSYANLLTTSGCGIDGKNLAATGGVQSHTLSVGEITNHSHSGSTDYQDTLHTHGFTSGGVSANHTHTHPQVYHTGGPADDGSNSADFYNTSVGTGGVSADHSHGFSSIETKNIYHTHEVLTNYAGSGTSHENLQPSVVINFIIKF